MSDISVPIYGAPRLKLQYQGTVSRVLLSCLDRQAAAGVLPGKRGPVTLHGGNRAEIWSTAQPQDDGSISFPSPIAFLLSQYGADELTPEWQEIFCSELQAALPDDAWELPETGQEVL